MKEVKIITVDGVQLKKNDKVWEIGISIDGKGYRPTLSVNGGTKNRINNPNRCWDSYQLCLKECEKKNASYSKFLPEILGDEIEKCQQCGNHDSVEEHVCPYDEDIKGIQTMCNCCSHCEKECLNNI